MDKINTDSEQQNKSILATCQPANDNIQEVTMNIQEQDDSHYYRMSSTSDEEFLGFKENDDRKNSWQAFGRSWKRRKINTTTRPITVNNRFQVLAETNETTLRTDNNTEKNIKIPKPPPIFVYDVVNYEEMVKRINTTVGDEKYTTKCLADNTIKINCETPDTYRKLIKYMRENNVIHHTYQPKEERAFRIVMKYIHHTTDPNEIKQELGRNGHKVRNIMNGRHRVTKEPLNIFFVDLEPAENNKEVYKLQYLQHCSIHIEPPRKMKGITQCLRCQQYGHSKSYCNRPYVCVKCGGAHSTTSCAKKRDTPAKCALCGGDHPANYKGCEFYHKLLKTNNANNRLNIQNKNSRNNPIISPSNTTQNKQHQKNNDFNTSDNQNQPNLHQHSRSYANAVKNTPMQQSNDINNVLTTFLEEFKTMFQQLMHQNTLVLNMLTTLITKIQ